ncbi:MAG: hypothetical protein ACQESB_00955 [Elusimicrobiota bacterium]
MKASFLFLISLFLFTRPLFPAPENPLDLGDVYIWGEDMSIFEGLEKKDPLLFPFLDKSAFLDAYSGDVFEKASPREVMLPSEGLQLHAGVGSYEEYLLRVSHSLLLDPWELNWRFSGEHKYPYSRFDSLSSMSGYAGTGFSFRDFKIHAILRGMVDEGLIEREVYKLKLLGALSLGNMSFKPQAYITPARSEGMNYVDSGASLSLSKDIAYYHTLGVKASVQESGNDEKKLSFSRLSLIYDSRIFRDFSFSLQGSFVSEGEFEYKGNISGDMPGGGYRLYYKSGLREFSLYERLQKSNALAFDGLLKNEKSDKYGIALYRDMKGLGSAEVKFSRENIENKIVYVKNDEGIYNPLNLSFEPELSELSLGIKRKPFYAGFIFRRSRPRIPFYSNQFNLAFKPQWQTGDTLLSFSTELNYTDEKEIWESGEGREKSSDEDVLELNAGGEVQFANGIFFRFGADNILKENIRRRASFPIQGRRFYVIGGINFPVGK